jgi:hypothetical protein
MEKGWRDWLLASDETLVSRQMPLKSFLPKEHLKNSPSAYSASSALFKNY